MALLVLTHSIYFTFYNPYLEMKGTSKHLFINSPLFQTLFGDHLTLSMEREKEKHNKAKTTYFSLLKRGSKL